jgi:hypothetical protein
MEATRNRTLLDITDDLRTLDILLEEAGGDITNPEVEDAINQWIAELQSDLDNKCDNYCSLIRTKELRTAARVEEAERLMASAKTETNQVRMLKDRLKAALTAIGVKKAGYKRTATVCGNGGVAPLEITQPDQLPHEFLSVTVTLPHVEAGVIQVEHWKQAGYKVAVNPNEAAIRAAIQSGREIIGCVILERGTHLRIK